ncbi:MAG: helix-turn-helix domain-containing protein [Lachnospiraceae bacterium]|nr:helix-turn-helix domain-containing protein [Lachnospiraceae bacterium]
MHNEKQSTGINPKKYYTVTEAAKEIGVHRSTVWRWVKSLRLRSRTRLVNNRKEFLGADLMKLFKHI